MSPPSNDRWMPPFDVTRVHFALSTRTHLHTHTHTRARDVYVRTGEQPCTTHKVFGVFDDGCLEVRSWKPGDSEVGEANRVSMSLPLGN